MIVICVVDIIVNKNGNKYVSEEFSLNGCINCGVCKTKCTQIIFQNIAKEYYYKNYKDIVACGLINIGKNSKALRLFIEINKKT